MQVTRLGKVAIEISGDCTVTMLRGHGVDKAGWRCWRRAEGGCSSCVGCHGNGVVCCQ